MGPGVDPHLYKASEGDVRRLTRGGADPLQRAPPGGEDGRHPHPLARSAAGGGGHRGDPPEPAARAPGVRRAVRPARLVRRLPVAADARPHGQASLRRSIRRMPRSSKANAEAYGKELDALDAEVKQRIADPAAHPAGAGDGSRRLRLLRAALRHGGGGHPGDQHPLRGRPSRRGPGGRTRGGPQGEGDLRRVERAPAVDRGRAGGGALARLRGRRSAASSSPTRWAAPTPPPERTRAWSAPTSKPSSRL